ncbi:MAG: carboxypeptidase M32, partial [Candidatus Dormibacteraeota bacterium]|nr:carboxypeptidase M32 [Candidatus Dormibacteraeota bacterium]
MSALEELKTVLAEVTDLYRVGGLLEWDQETHMPAGGVAARARESALVSRLAHERFTSDHVRSLLERAEGETQTLAEDSDDRSLVRVARRDFDDATKLPPALVEEMARTQAESQPVW